MEAQKPGGVEANGWAYNLNAGKWGQDFDLRATIALRGLGQNTPEEAIYMNVLKDGDKQRLNGAKKYTITFKKGELPPVDGFWSVSMYDASDFFVENPLNRNAIGNRTEGLKTAPGRLADDLRPEGRSRRRQDRETGFRRRMEISACRCGSMCPRRKFWTGKWTPPAVTPQP